MAVTTINLDQPVLDAAKRLTGARTDRDVVDLALRTLIAVRQQTDAVERIISRDFSDDQIGAPVIDYDAPRQPSA